MVVASWNVREVLPVDASNYSMLESRQKAREEIVEFSHNFEVDVLGLQEVDFDARGNSPTLQHVVENTDLVHFRPFPLSPSSYFDGDLAGVAVLSRYPISGSVEGMFLNPQLSGRLEGNLIESHDKGFVAAEIELAVGMSIWCASLHAFPFHMFEREPNDPRFEEVWRDIARQLHTLNAPIVLLGDFNATDRALLLRHLSINTDHLNKGGITYKDMAADDIVVSSEIKLYEGRSVSTFSDHSALVGELEVSNCAT